MEKGQIKQKQDNITYIVYMHIAPNNKKYIGITKEKNPKERWRKGKGYWTNEHFTSAINKYGWDNIQHIILYKELTKEQKTMIKNVLVSNGVQKLQELSLESLKGIATEIK